MLYHIENLTRVHGGRVILDIPALDLRSGRIYSLIGPNGAGKTTLLHILAFLDQPTAGKITYRETLVRYSEQMLLPLRRQVVLVDQTPILFTGPVWKNLDFGLKVRKIERQKRQALIEEALDLVGMLDFFDAEAQKLSGGETKRVALARALVVQPEVLLCDEPTANVDMENVAILLDILVRANKKLGVSIVFTTHSNSEAQQLAQHTLVLKNGRLSNLPRDNVYAARLVETVDDKATFMLQDTLPIQVPARPAFPRTGKVQLHLDPHALSLTRNQSEFQPGTHYSPGKVTAIAAEKEKIRVTVDIGLPVTVFLSLSEYAEARLYIGETVFLAIDEGAITIE
jgi:tungstate transport system ATP-binding protein